MRYLFAILCLWAGACGAGPYFAADLGLAFRNGPDSTYADDSGTTTLSPGLRFGYAWDAGRSVELSWVTLGDSDGRRVNILCPGSCGDLSLSLPRLSATSLRYLFAPDGNERMRFVLGYAALTGGTTDRTGGKPSTPVLGIRYSRGTTDPYEYGFEIIGDAGLRLSVGYRWGG